MHISINVTIVIVVVNYSVDVHQVLDEGVSHRECGFYRLRTIEIVGHFKGKLALSVYARCRGLITLVDDAEGMVLPVEVG